MSDFITIWKTDNPDANLDDYTIALPLRGFTHNITVDWGDGTTDTITDWSSPDRTHTYSTIGTYTVSISGTLGWGFDSSAFDGELKLLEVSQWGTSVTFVEYLNFDGCENVDITATDVPSFSGSLNGGVLFHECYSLINSNGSIGLWDVSNFTTFASAFRNTNQFNQDIGLWDVSNVTNMYSMFRDSSSFSQDLSGWCVELITTKPSSFDTGSSLTSEQLPEWGTCPQPIIHELTGSSILTTTVLENPYITVIYSINTDTLTLSAPTLEDAQLIQQHLLSGNGITLTPSLESSNLTQDIAIIPSTLDVSPIITSPNITQQHFLDGDSLTINNIEVSSTYVADKFYIQIHNLKSYINTNINLTSYLQESIR